MSAAQPLSAVFVPYGQGQARGLDEEQLGTHGVELDRLVALGLPVVPGLTVPVAHATSLEDVAVARAGVELLEQLAGRSVRDVDHSVLVRLVASCPNPNAGAPADLPGIGITEQSAVQLNELVGSDDAIYDVLASVVRFVGEHGAGIPGDDFADAEYDA